MLSIDILGSPHDGKGLKGVVYRLPGLPARAPKFPYLTVSDSINSMQAIDIITLPHFHRSKEALKQKLRKGLGIEFHATRARKLNGHEIAMWFSDLREAYAFCESSGCQFILSSGASSPSQMISGSCFDEILEELGIDSQRYWKELQSWLAKALSRKVVIR